MGGPHHPGSDLVRPRGDPGHHHPVHGPVRAARRPREADAGQADGPLPGRVLDRVQGRARVRVRPPEERPLPQRRGDDRRGREVLLRALPGRERHPAQEQGGPGGGGRPPAGPLRPQAGLARLPRLLRDPGHRRGLDRAQEVRGAGGRGGIQEGPGRGGPLQVRRVQAGRGADPRGPRGLLAKAPRGEDPGVPHHPRRVETWPTRSPGRWPRR